MDNKATIEQVRGYWDARPCNIRHSWVDIDEDPLAYSRQVSGRKYYVEPHIPLFARHYNWNGKMVLELGCGIGTDAIEFAKGGAEVWAKDISKESVKIARQRAGAEGVLENINFIVGDVEDHVLYETDDPRILRKYKDYMPNMSKAIWTGHGMFDLVYSFGVIHHTPNPRAVLGSSYWMLKPGGTLKVMLYHRRSWKVLRILLTNMGKLLKWRDIDKVVALESEAQTGCPITHTYTRKKATDMLIDIGYSVQNVSVEHIFPYKVSEYVKHKYVKAFPWNIMPDWLFRWLEHKIGWHLCITATQSRLIAIVKEKK